MSTEKEMGRYLDGLVTLFHIINTQQDLDKASDVIHDLLLGYGVVDDYETAYKRGFKEAKELFVEFPRQDDMFFNKNDSLAKHVGTDFGQRFTTKKEETK